MADAPVVHIGENSPEEVALKLFKFVADVEKKTLYVPHNAPSSGATVADRKWILDTYSECLYAVVNPGSRS